MDKRVRDSSQGFGEFTIFSILNFILFVISLVITGVMIWVRIDWGFQEWIHEMAFTNFWNGAYVLFTGTIFALINCGLGIVGVFQGWSVFLSFVRMFHAGSALLLFIGSVTMLSDAIGMRPKWIRQILLELIDPSHYINTMAKEKFLRNLYRIAYCCGADNYKDYPEIFHISPPQECINYRYAGALYYEEGCSTALSRWLKEWAGGLTTASCVMILIEVLLVWMISRILRNKKRKSNNHIDEFYSPDPPRRTTSLSRLNNLSHDTKRIILRPKHPKKPSLVHSTSLLNEPPLYDIPQMRERNEINQITRARSESFIVTNHPPLPQRIARSRSKPQDILHYFIQPKHKKRSRDFSHLNNQPVQSKSNVVKNNFKGRQTKQESILKWNFVLPKRPIQKESRMIDNTNSDCNSSLLSNNRSFETSI